MPHKNQTKDQRINDIEESLKLTREQKLLVERLGDMPRDKIATIYEQSPTLIKVQGVWKQLRITITSSPSVKPSRTALITSGRVAPLERGARHAEPQSAKAA
jgi:hypothetical protein